MTVSTEYLNAIASEDVADPLTSYGVATGSWVLSRIGTCISA